MTDTSFIHVHHKPLQAGRTAWRSITADVVVGKWRYTATAIVTGEARMTLDAIQRRHRRGWLRRALGIPGRLTTDVKPRIEFLHPYGFVARSTLTKARVK